MKQYSITEFKKLHNVTQIDIRLKRAGYQGTSPVFAIAKVRNGEDMLLRAQDTDWTQVQSPAIIESVDDDGVVSYTMYDTSTQRAAVASF
jgi:hypothetical protein